MATAAGMVVVARDANGLADATGKGMGFGPQGAFLMDVSADGHQELLDELTDLSANKGAYALREAYSNAHDATLAAGDMSRPIEISIPEVAAAGSTLAEKLAMLTSVVDRPLEYALITDHGVGMTEWELRHYFAQYGSSDKRHAAESIGSKGLGSKAPLACADFFDVVSCKGGMRTTMHLWRSNGGNYAEITSSVPCPADETGTTVRIPVTDAVTAQQMLECAQEIAKRNIDATIVINGHECRGELGCEQGATYLHDGTQYVFLGSLRIGVDQNGDAVMVPAWVDAKCLDVPEFITPTTDGHAYTRSGVVSSSGVEAVLCGVGYALPTGGPRPASHRAPALIVGVEPGYLNFTVSRDEVKEDAKLTVFRDALFSALDSLDLWTPLLRRLMQRGGGLGAVREWFAGTTATLGRRGQGWLAAASATDWMEGRGHIITDEDERIMALDGGGSALPIVATLSCDDPDGHEARGLAWFSSRYDGKAPRFHAALRDDEGKVCGCDLRPWDYDAERYGSYKGYKNSCGSAAHALIEFVAGIPRMPMVTMARQGAGLDWTVMVLGGVTDDNEFVKAEPSLRRHVARGACVTTRNARVMYLLLDDPVADESMLTEAERAMLGLFADHEVALLEDMVRTCREEDQEGRASSGTARPRKKCADPLGTLRCVSVDLDEMPSGGIADMLRPCGDAEPLPDLAPQYVDLETLCEDDLVVLGMSDREAVRESVVTATWAAICAGLIDDTYGRLVIVPCTNDGKPVGTPGRLHAPKARRLARQVTVLADMRQSWAVDVEKGIADGIGEIHREADGTWAIDASVVPRELRGEAAVSVSCIGSHLLSRASGAFSGVRPSVPLAGDSIAAMARLDGSFPTLRVHEGGDGELALAARWVYEAGMAAIGHPLGGLLSGGAKDPTTAEDIRGVTEFLMPVVAASIDEKVLAWAGGER